METKKKSFILYLDQRDLFDKLPDEIAGKLIKHIFSYVNLEKPVPDDLLIDIAFSSIKQSLKRDLSKWENLRNQRSEAGRASAEKRANEKQRKSTSVESRTTKAQRSPTKSTVSVSVSVSDSVSVSKINTKVFIAPTPEDVIKYFKENGYDENLASRAFKYYDTANWKDSKGKQVKNWKQKMQGVWFKEENKTKQTSLNEPLKMVY